MQTLSSQTKYIKSLTGLRALAAYMVFFHHFNPIKARENCPFLFDFFSEMHIGVTLFFFLSGYLITYRYYHTKIDWKNYLKNRFTRIYPIYFLLTLATFVFWFIKDSIFQWKLFLLNLTFLRGFFDVYKFTGISQGWSLTVEEFFYFTAPIFFLLLRKNKYFFIIIPAFLLLIGLSIYLNQIDFMLDFTFFGRSLEFFCGMFLAIYFDKIKSFLRFRVTLISIVLLLLSLYTLILFKPSVHTFGTDVLCGKLLNTVFLPFFVFIPLFYGLIEENTVFRRILETKIFEILGKSSYVFYLIHLGVFSSFIVQRTNYIGHFLALNILAIAIHVWIEQPLSRFVKFALRS